MADDQKRKDRPQLTDLEIKEAWTKFTADVESASANRWPDIHRALAPGMSDAIDARGKHVACPSHGGVDGFRIFQKTYTCDGGAVCNSCGPKKTGFTVLSWLNSYSRPGDVYKEVGKYLGINFSDYLGGAKVRAPVVIVRDPPRHVPAKVDMRAESKTRKQIMNVIDASKAVEWGVDGDLVSRYLVNRGHVNIAEDPPFDLLFSPSTALYAHKAILGADGEPVR